MEFRGGENPLFARWTTDFDVEKTTEWWYVIKDTPFDLLELKAKRRYEINKGLKNFTVEKIDPTQYIDEICLIQREAYSAYPKEYRPTLNEEQFKKAMEEWSVVYDAIYGAFFKEDKRLCGYVLLKNKGRCIDFTVMKTRPSLENKGVNAALVYTVVSDLEEHFNNGGYICDGERNINHKTAFPDYLEKYFGFRKAYCRLRIVYNPKIKWIVYGIYPFRGILKKFDSIGLIHKINGVLMMESIRRRQE